jgi:hypothetical protein
MNHVVNYVTTLKCKKGVVLEINHHAGAKNSHYPVGIQRIVDKLKKFQLTCSSKCICSFLIHELSQSINHHLSSHGRMIQFWHQLP